MFGSCVVINIEVFRLFTTLAILFVVAAGTTQQHAVAVIVAVPTEPGALRVESSDFVSPCTQRNRKARKDKTEVVSLYSSAVAAPSATAEDLFIILPEVGTDCIYYV